MPNCSQEMNLCLGPQIFNPLKLDHMSVLSLSTRGSMRNSFSVSGGRSEPLPHCLVSFLEYAAVELRVHKMNAVFCSPL